MIKKVIDARRVGIFGASGSGKTTKALDIVKNCRRLIVVDVLDDFVGKFKRFTDLSELKRYCIYNYIKGFRVSYVPPYGAEIRALDELSSFIRNLQAGYKNNKHSAKVTLFVDELNRLFPLGYTRERPLNGFGFLCNQGRHYGVNLVGVSQRVSQVDMPFRSNLSDVYFFRMADFNDIKAAVSIVGSQNRQRILDLQNYKYIYKDDKGVNIQ